MVQKRHARFFQKTAKERPKTMKQLDSLQCYVAVLTCLILFIAEVESSNSTCKSSFYSAPVCISTPGEYICKCSPGFIWNGNFCMANAVNSKLVFPNNMRTDSYVELVGKTFPSIKGFTIALWVNFSGEMLRRNTTLVSYTTQRDEVKFIGGSSFKLVVAGEEVPSQSIRVIPGRWVHLAVTWTGKDGSWATYSDGERRNFGFNLATGESITSGGKLIIGNSPEGESSNSSIAVNYIGDIGQVHVWDNPLSAWDINKIYEDCTFSYCGNVVEWTDFRSGTRGEVKLLWHSRIFEYCGIDRSKSCDKYCSDTLGLQCKADYDENLEWPRTSVGSTVRLPCPSIEEGSASRTCREDKALEGEWEKANISQCISQDLLLNLNQIKEALQSGNVEPITTTYLLKNVTKIVKGMSKVTNPSDLAACIEIADLFVKLQRTVVDKQTWQERRKSYKNLDNVVFSYPTITDTLDFSKGVMELIDNLLDGTFDVAWNATKPRGYEAVQLLEVLDHLSSLIVKSLTGHVTRMEISLSYAKAAFDMKAVALFVKLSEQTDLAHVTLPDDLQKSKIMEVDELDGALENGVGKLRIPDYEDDKYSEMEQDHEHVEDVIGYSFIKLTELYWLLPNHPEPVIVKFYREKHLEFAHLENNVNTAVLSFTIYKPSGEKETVPASTSEPLVYELSFVNTFNISNPACVHLNKSQGPKDWTWETDGCELNVSNEYKAVCQCYHVGFFAITTHMYDVNWDPGEPPRFFPLVPMYVGCVFSISFFGISLVAFFYFRCVTDTVAVHRNLAVSEILLQVIFLAGTPRIQNEWVCRIITILIHGLFVTSFGWICNEAFNLYVEVANTIHSEHQQQRPMLRYHVIGWFAPGILVSVLAITNWQEYFSSDVCFMDLSFVWFMLGPAAGIWAITVFVLIYTGKDISESSYFRDEKSNKVITNHCKGCWIQITLIMITWAFALLSVEMLSIIPQILFAMFDILQGVFFFTFFCCLNGEVTEAINDYRMGMTQTSGLQRTTRYSIYRRYVPRPTTRRTLSNVSGGSSGASATPKRNSLNNEQTEEEEPELPPVAGTNKNVSLREQVLRGSVDKMRLLKSTESAAVEDEDPLNDLEELKDAKESTCQDEEEVTYSDPTNDIVTYV